MLSPVHASLLRDLCTAIDDADRFRAAWRKDGETLENDRGGLVAHPMIAAEAAARTRVNLLRRELGLTPAAAARVSAPAPAAAPKDSRKAFLTGARPNLSVVGSST